MQRRSLLHAAGATIAGATLLPGHASANAWPTREINFILPVATGGGADTMVRVITPHVQRELGVNIVIKNYANGPVGFSEILKSAPDGYTIGVGTIGSLIAMPAVSKVPYKRSDFELLAGFAEPLYGLCVSASSPIKTMEDLIELAKKRPVSCGSANITNQIVMIQLGNVIGGRFKWIPTASPAEAAAQVVGGHVECVCGALEITPLVQGGQLRMLASACDHRWPAFPEVRTLKEMGLKASNKVTLMVVAPKGLPNDARSRLETAFLNAARAPEVQQRAKALGLMPSALSSRESEADFDLIQPIVLAAVEQAGLKRADK